MRLTCFAVAAATAATGAYAQPLRAAETCEDILPRAQVQSQRPLEPEDLVRLRDIGPIDAELFGAPLFSVAPDGERAAFQIRRASPATNSICLGILVVELDGSAAPRVVDSGGEMLLVTIENKGNADFPTGIPQVVTPIWAADGRSIFFLKRVRGQTQVWRAAVDGNGSGAVTHSLNDVTEFALTNDEQSLVYATRPGLVEARQAIAREGLSGYHYDERWAPVDGAHPFPVQPISRAFTTLDLRTGAVRPATAAEKKLLGDGSLFDPPREAQGNPAVWITATDLLGGAKPAALRARLTDGATITCAAQACIGAVKPWIVPARRVVRFFAREGWARETTAIYEWNPASGVVRRLYATTDVLASCLPEEEALLCFRDSSLAPRRLERLNLATGERQLLFDPNPEFQSLSLGKAERLHWRNAEGIEAFGDLVLPVSYERGRRYPLIVVQYATRGFLRGGTGDEYPIQPFANRGFAVLSVQRPLPIAILKGATSYHEGDKLNLEGFADQRSAFSSIATGVRAAVARGVADPDRLGISGLSNGSMTVVWSLLHSDMFRAAAMSSCCFDTGVMSWVGPASAAEYREDGYPGMLNRNAPFWREFSLATNAARVRTPILLQLADFEYLNALETYTTLREAGAPIDMFVFPDEFHNKWQPAHRLAVYRRSLDWFGFWLNGADPGSPEGIAAARHWRALAAERRTKGGSRKREPVGR